MSTTQITPYLFLNGRCDEALSFYEKALGAHVEFRMSFDEAPDPPPPGMVPAGWEKKVMHATVRIGGATLMASDGCASGGAMQGFSLSLAYPTEAEARRAFEALGDGGQVNMPMGRTFWSPCFGMVVDRLGVSWMVTVIPGS